MLPTHYLIYGPLRFGQFVFAGIFARPMLKGITRSTNASAATIIGLVVTATMDANFIYTIIVAGSSIALALFWLFPRQKMTTHFLTDVLLFIMWTVAFGVFTDYIKPMGCGSIWAWGDIVKGGTCSRWKAAVAFSFLSTCFWLLTALTVTLTSTGSRVKLLTISRGHCICTVINMTGNSSSLIH